MAEAAEKLSKKEVMRYATEQLHAVRPQPAGIPTMLAALQQSLDGAEEEAKLEKEEGPPKDFDEAVARIDKAVGKLENPPKEKADLKQIAGPEGVTEYGTHADQPPQGIRQHHEPQGPAIPQEPKPKK